MDSHLTALASRAGSHLVRSLETNLWEQGRSAVAQLWQRVHPDHAAIIDAQIVEARADLVRDPQVAPDLTAEWQARFRRALTADPGLASDVQRLLDALPGRPQDQSWSGDVDLRARASGNAQIYQVGQGNQYIDGSR